MEIRLSEISFDIRPTVDNPRNSEGDFIRLKDGRILFAYSRYGTKSAHDNAPCDIYAVVSEDNGQSFGEPFPLALASEHGVKNIMSVSLIRLENGDIGLFYIVKHDNVGNSSYVMRRSTDECKSFLPPVQCLPDKFVGYYVINNCRVLKTSDGRLLIPAAFHRYGLSSLGNILSDHYGMGTIFESKDDGHTFRELTHPISLSVYSETGLQEPGLLELDNGTLYAYFRTDQNCQYESFSHDGGIRWSAPQPSCFTSPDSPMKIAKNPYSGRFYAIWNPIPKYNGRITNEQNRWVTAGRTPLYLAESDDGIHFEKPVALETDPKRGFCYPAIFFLSENEMLISYCSGGAEDGMCLARTTIRRIKI